MAELKVTYSPRRCVGNGVCARLDPLRFALKGKKAQLIGGQCQGEAVVLEKEFSEQDVQQIINAAKHCPTNAIKVEKKGEVVVATELHEKSGAQTIRAEYDDLKEFVMDPKGYFLIRTVPEKKEIEVALCSERNTISKKVVGKKPLEIYQTCIKQEMLTRHDHAAYLGRELQKAFISLELGLNYVQDDELKF